MEVVFQVTELAAYSFLLWIGFCTARTGGTITQLQFYVNLFPDFTRREFCLPLPNVTGIIKAD
jgi:hypothetical protein